MESVKQRFTINLEYEMTINPDTGEILNTELIKRTSKQKDNSSSKKNESSEPQLILESNKYSLNTAAVELMGITLDDKLDIKYEKNNNTMIPVIGTDENFGTKGGNKISKSNTVVCRGSKNEELSKYGKVFTVEVHPTKEGLFILKGDAPKDIVEISKDDEDLPLDIDLSALNVDMEEINSFDFKL